MTAERDDQGQDLRVAWETLFERSYAQLYRTAVFLLSASEAEDVVQEAFERAMKQPEFHDTVREPVAWLRTVVARIAIDRLRRRQLWDRLRPGVPSPASVSSPEAVANLRDALRRLAPRSRVALVLRYYQDAPYEEIASALGLARESVGPLLHRAKLELREVLGE